MNEWWRLKSEEKNLRLKQIDMVSEYCELW